MVEKILKVRGISLGRLNNAEYLRLMSRILEQIKLVGAHKVGLLQEQVSDFEQKLLILNDVFAQNRARVETSTMKELDKQRNMQWNYLLQRIQIASSSPLVVEKTASSMLTPEIKPYIGKQRVAIEQQTQLIKGFLFDMQKSENFTQIQALGLLPSLDALEDFNNRYAALSDTRTINKQTTKMPNSEVLRQEIDFLFDYICNKIFAENISHLTADTTLFMISLNSFIEAANTAYKQRMAQTKKKDAHTEEKSELGMMDNE